MRVWGRVRTFLPFTRIACVGRLPSAGLHYTTFAFINKIASNISSAALIGVSEMARNIWKEHWWWIIPAIIVAVIMVVSIYNDRPAYGAELTKIERIFSILKSETSPVRFNSRDGRIKASAIEQDGGQFVKFKFDECLYYGVRVWEKHVGTLPCPYWVEVTYLVDMRGIPTETYVNCNGASPEHEHQLRWYRKKYVDDAQAISRLATVLIESLTKKTASQ